MAHTVRERIIANPRPRRRRAMSDKQLAIFGKVSGSARCGELSEPGA